MITLNELKKLAEAATYECKGCEAKGYEHNKKCYETYRNAQILFSENANPSTILKLISVIEEMRGALEHYRYIAAPSASTADYCTADMQHFAEEALAKLKDLE